MRTSKNTDIITTNQTLVKKNTKHNYKLSEEDKQSIVLEYYLNRSKENIEDICNKYSITKQSIYNIVKNEKYQKLLNKHIIETRQNFSKKTSILIDKAIDKLQNKIDNEDANIKDLTTAIGILYDKNRLENNLSTSNNSININLKIER